MHSPLPSPFGLLSLTMKRFSSRAKPFSIAFVTTGVLLSAALLLYGRYAVAVVPFSEGTVVPSEHALALTIATVVVTMLLLVGFWSFVLQLATHPKRTPVQALRNAPLVIPTLFLWWLSAIFVPGTIIGFFTSSATPEIAVNVITLAVFTVTLSLTMLIPVLTLEKGMWFFRALPLSVRSTAPILHRLVLRMMLAGFCAIVAGIVALAIAALSTYISTSIAASVVIMTLWSTLMFCMVSMFWMIYLVVFSEHLTFLLPHHGHAK